MSASLSSVCQLFFEYSTVQLPLLLYGALGWANSSASLRSAPVRSTPLHWAAFLCALNGRLVERKSQQLNMVQCESVVVRNVEWVMQPVRQQKHFPESIQLPHGVNHQGQKTLPGNIYPAWQTRYKTLSLSFKQTCTLAKPAAVFGSPLLQLLTSHLAFPTV